MTEAEMSKSQFEAHIESLVDMPRVPVRQLRSMFDSQDFEDFPQRVILEEIEGFPQGGLTMLHTLPEAPLAYVKETIHNNLSRWQPLVIQREGEGIHATVKTTEFAHNPYYLTHYNPQANDGDGQAVTYRMVPVVELPVQKTRRINAQQTAAIVRRSDVLEPRSSSGLVLPRLILETLYTQPGGGPSSTNHAAQFEDFVQESQPYVTIGVDPSLSAMTLKLRNQPNYNGTSMASSVLEFWGPTTWLQLTGLAFYRDRDTGQFEQLTLAEDAWADFTYDNPLKVYEHRGLAVSSVPDLLNKVPPGALLDGRLYTHVPLADLLENGNMTYDAFDSRPLSAAKILSDACDIRSGNDYVYDVMNVLRPDMSDRAQEAFLKACRKAVQQWVGGLRTGTLKKNIHSWAHGYAEVARGLGNRPSGTP